MLRLFHFLIIIFFLFPAILSTQSLALSISDECKVSSDVEFFDLTAFAVEPYVPSLDENGVPYLKGADLANAEINHYRKQYESAPIVRLSMDRYASLTANSADAFKNFESRIIVVDPECNELKLFFGNLIGKSVTREAQLRVSLIFLPHFDVCDPLLYRTTVTWKLHVHFMG